MSSDVVKKDVFTVQMSADKGEGRRRMTGRGRGLYTEGGKRFRTVNTDWQYK